MNSSIFGFISAIVIFFYSIYLVVENSVNMVDRVSILIVLGGTISISIMSYGLKDVFRILGSGFKTFLSNKFSTQKLLQQLVEISEKLFDSPATINSLLEEKKYHPFIKDGLKLIQNKFTDDQIEQIMVNSTEERKVELGQQINMALNVGKYPPAFGMIGTIIGLVAVLQSMGNIDNMEKLGPMMAVALITTLYGLFLANFIIVPLANRLEENLNQDLKHRRVIIEGIILINKNEDPILVQEMLKTFLNPKAKAQIEKAQVSNKGKLAA